MTTNRTPATAADFVEYVAEARAEGLTDAEILVRYFKQARLGAEFSVDSCPDGASLTWTKSKYDTVVFDVTFDCPAAGRYECVVEKPDYGELSADTLAWSDELSLESVLAWLANQLAEHCPVGVMTDEEFFALPDKRREDMSIRAAEWYERNITHGIYSTRQSRERILDKCRLLRRMFGIGESTND